MVAVHVEDLELGGLRATQRLQELTYLTDTVGEGEGRGSGVIRRRCVCIHCSQTLVGRKACPPVS